MAYSYNTGPLLEFLLKITKNYLTTIVRGHHSPTPAPPIVPAPPVVPAPPIVSAPPIFPAIPVVPAIPDSPNTSAIMPRYVPPHRQRPNYRTISGARL